MLEKKVAIVTGATGALGRVVTKKLLENGVEVVALYRTEDRLEGLSEFLGDLKTGLKGFKGDATAWESVKRLVEEAFEEHGRLDILLNIAGGYAGGKTIDKTDKDEWDHMMDINLKSAFLCSKAALPYMIEGNYGKIVNVAARTAVRKGRRARSGAYAVSKAGVIVLTETIAEEAKRHDITVNCIMPSVIDTPANREMFPRADFSKWVDPDEIAEVILFLASDESKSTSGAKIPVYGKA